MTHYEKTHRRIIDTAMELIKETPLSKLPVERIYEKLGISRSAFYYHFASKGELALAIFDFRTIVTPQRVAWALSAPDLWGRVLRLQTSYIAQILRTKDPDTLRIYREHMSLLPEGQAEEQDRDLLKELLVPLVADAQEKGIFRNQSDPGLLCDTNVAMQRGLNDLWIQRKGNFDLMEQICILSETIYDVTPEYRGRYREYDLLPQSEEGNEENS